MRIFHISDLHMRDADDWRRDLVLGAAWERNLERILKDGPIDVVCFTGDVAHSGREQEYARASEFLAGTLAKLGLAPCDLFVVPGNHDVDRDVHPDAYGNVRAGVRHGRDMRLSRYLAGREHEPPEGMQAEWLAELGERQAAYRRWLEDFGLTHLVGASPYGFRIERESPRVTLIGLNTAWLSGPDDHRLLLLTEDHVHDLLGDEEDGSLRVALMHHSFADLLDARSVQRQLAGRIDVVLRGHLHRAESAHYLIDHGRGFAEFAVSSLYDSHELDRYANGCQVIDLDPGADLLHGRTWIRSWSGAFWHSDNSVHEQAVDGRLDWSIVRRTSTKKPGGYLLLQRDGPVSTPSPYADYLRSLRRQVSRDGVSTGLMRPDRVYVPQRVLPPGAGDDEGDPAGERELLEVMEGFWSGSDARILVLGNYGMGKTYFALRTVLQQAGAFVDPAARRIPIYFALRDLDCSAALESESKRRRDIIGQILGRLHESDFPAADRDAFKALIASGAVGIVLDGLDELKTRSSKWELLLAPLLDIDGSFCCVTSRTAEVGDPTALRAAWDVHVLREWRPDVEWPAYVAECAGQIDDVEQLLKTVGSKPRLRSLTSRPLWCFMIVDVRERVCAAQHDIDEAQLYKYFIDRALEQVMRTESQMQLLTTEQKLISLERVARRTLETNQASLSHDDVLRVLEQQLQELDMSGLREFLDRELRVYSFLNVDRDLRYSFGHASFGAYFLAAAAARELLRHFGPVKPGARDVRDTWLANNELDPEELAFCAGILASRPPAILAAGSPQDVVGQLEGFVREWMSRTRAPALRRNLVLLLVLLVQRRRQDRGAPGRLSRLTLRRAPLTGADFSGLELDDVNFGQARLQGASFAGGTLRGCSFDYAVLRGASFAGSTLCACSFEHADIDGADFTGAIATPPIGHREPIA